MMLTSLITEPGELESSHTSRQHPWRRYETGKQEKDSQCWQRIQAHAVGAALLNTFSSRRKVGSWPLTGNGSSLATNEAPEHPIVSYAAVLTTLQHTFRNPRCFPRSPTRDGAEHALGSSSFEQRTLSSGRPFSVGFFPPRWVPLEHSSHPCPWRSTNSSQHSQEGMLLSHGMASHGCESHQ